MGEGKTTGSSSTGSVFLKTSVDQLKVKVPPQPPPDLHIPVTVVPVFPYLWYTVNEDYKIMT